MYIKLLSNLKQGKGRKTYLKNKFSLALSSLRLLAVCGDSHVLSVWNPIVGKRLTLLTVSSDMHV